MKQFKILQNLTLTLSMALLLFSCGSGEEKKADETTTTDTSALNAPEPAPSAKPGKVLIIKHKVASFAKWKRAYESHDSVRLSHSLTNYILGRGIDDSNMVVVFLKMDDVTKAKELTGSQGIKERMQKGGVTGKPSFTYLETVMDDNSEISENARLMISHKVKDWDAWKKEFDKHKQVRMEAGLIDRGLGHNVDDNKMVSIVFAITDKQKADAFLKSQDLKDKMTAAGVEGPPNFFYYNIVQKY